MKGRWKNPIKGMGWYKDTKKAFAALPEDCAETIDGENARMTTHAADSHDLIRVQGARVNNLKDISVEIPKRRLTVFTGVSGSGKSSLVFGTIAAESQRLINETYSAFVQGFMPSLARPEVDAARGPDDGDHRRPGADGRQPALDGRHRDRRQRDAADPLQPPRRPATSARRTAYSFNVPTRKASGMMTIEKGGQTERKDRRSRRSTSAACARAARAWARSTTST